MKKLSRELIEKLALLQKYAYGDDGNIVATILLAKFYQEGISGDEAEAKVLFDEFERRRWELYKQYPKSFYYSNFCKDLNLEEDSKEADEKFNEWLLKNRQDEYKAFCEGFEKGSTQKTEEK